MTCIYCLHKIGRETMSQKIEEFARVWIGPVAFALLMLYAFMFALSETIPDHKPAPAGCSCAGLDNCSTAIFKPTTDTRAYCTLIEDGPSCCEIVRSDP